MKFDWPTLQEHFETDELETRVCSLTFPPFNWRLLETLKEKMDLPTNDLLSILADKALLAMSVMLREEFCRMELEEKLERRLAAKKEDTPDA